VENSHFLHEAKIGAAVAKEKAAVAKEKAAQAAAKTKEIAKERWKKGIQAAKQVLYSFF
jgi:hypothetical protein